ncbi:MAG: PEP-CTERM sorting domain-containing protein [Planctomycetota bacterium]|jgi:hypothetical protein
MRKIIFVILVTLVVVCQATGALWYSSGYNTFTNADPQDDEVFVENDAVLDFLSGTALGLRVIDTATANIYGGSITYDLYTSGNSITNIYLIDLEILCSAQNSVLNLYAYDVDFYSTGGINNDGYMTGTFYQDNVSFEIDFVNPGTVSHINVVPEPATLLLLGLGGLFLRKRKS